MTTLLFLGCVAGIFLLVVAIEGDGEFARQLRHRPAGLLGWLTAGNWPAKVGAALIVVGVGALLRYALLNIDVPAQAKLAGGIVIAAALGFASMALPGGPARRTLSLALGGAAFGVAYLTAYSAFALFGYVPSGTGLALLALVSAGTAAYAVTRGAMALGILAMFGAYLAPAFAIGDPGPAVVYGYYAAASAMTLLLVALRGWRPLIHLSFVFTLAGGAFLAWTAGYYDPSYAEVMMPMLLLLAALHVAMPVVERSGTHAPWIERLDVIYMIALPAVLALLTFGIADSRASFSVMMLWYAVIWAAAAAATRVRGTGGAFALAVISALFLVLAAAARFRNIPWELLGLLVCVATLALVTRRQPGNGRLHSVAAGFVMLFGGLQALSTLTDHATGPLFANAVFFERLTSALLLIIAGILCRRARQVLDTLLLACGVVWLFIALGIELIRLDIATAALVSHWFCILLAASVWIPGRKLRWADDHPSFVGGLLALTAFWASSGSAAPAAWLSLVAAGAAALALACHITRLGYVNPAGRLGPVVSAVAAVAIWGLALRPPFDAGGTQFVLTLAAITLMLAMILMHRLAAPDDDVTDYLVAGVASGLATVLAMTTLLHLSRATWAGALEITCLAGLALALYIRNARGAVSIPLVVSVVVGIALVIQAWLVRWLAAPGPLSPSSVFELRQPALISLLWAAMGCVLTWWSRRAGSRALWIAGASLLIVSAVKMLLLDFGSLGQLTNILAVIAAGMVFLAVGWIAPMPPAATEAPAGTSHNRGPIVVSVAVVVGLIEMGQGSGSPAGAYQRLRTETPAAQALAPAPEVAAEPAPATDQPAVPAVDAEPAAPEPAMATPAPEISGPPTVTATAPPAAPTAPPAPMAPPAPPAARADWKPPPNVDAQGNRVYNDYNTPGAHAAPEPAGNGRDAQDRVSAPPSPGQGEEGLDMLVRQGRLARATQRDLDEYMSTVRGDPEATARLREGNRMVLTQPLRNVYIARRELTIPNGLYGAHSAVFIVPRGVPRPFGNPGHSSILEYPD